MSWPGMKSPAKSKKPSSSELSFQSGRTGIIVNRPFPAVAPLASANRRTSRDFPVPEFPARITKGFDRSDAKNARAVFSPKTNALDAMKFSISNKVSFVLRSGCFSDGDGCEVSIVGGTGGASAWLNSHAGRDSTSTTWPLPPIAARRIAKLIPRGRMEASPTANGPSFLTKFWKVNRLGYLTRFACISSGQWRVFSFCKELDIVATATVLTSCSSH